MSTTAESNNTQMEDTQNENVQKGDAPGGGAQKESGKRRRQILDGLATKYRIIPVLFTLVIIWAVFASRAPTFLTPRNMSNLSEQIAVTSILALGLVLVLLIGQIDLSVATLSAVSGGVAGLMVVNAGLPLFPAILIALAVGGGFGVLQGAIVVFTGAPALIVTLGGQMALQGVLLWMLPSSTGLIPLSGTSLQGVANHDIPPVYSYGTALLIGLIVIFLRWRDHRQRVQFDLPSRGSRALGIGVFILVGLFALAILFNLYRGVPMSVGILAILVAVLAYVLNQTRFGTWLYAIGGNDEAARRAGVPVRGIKVATFGVLGVVTALGGVVAASRVLGVSAASNDDTLLLQAIAAAVIGGTALFGGRGGVWAAVTGALVIGSIANGMFLLNASTEARLLVQGIVLVVAVAADALIARNSKAVSK